jgi:HlyD family secretion protein
MAMRFKPPDQKDEAQDLLRQERSRVAKPVGTRRTSRAAGAGAGGGGRRGNRSVTVYVLKDNRAQPVEIQLGITDGSRTEVRAGELNEKDPLIIATSSAAAASQSGVANPFQPQPQRGPGFGGFR